MARSIELCPVGRFGEEITVAVVRARQLGAHHRQHGIPLGLRPCRRGRDAGAVVNTQAGRVAYSAHIGGAVFGAAFARFFEAPRKPFA